MMLKYIGMGRITELLDAINSADENTEELYGIFRLVDDFDIPIIRFYLYPGAGLVRQRVNLIGTEFNEVSELSYPPLLCVTKYERANVPYQPMFYACSFPRGYNDETHPPRVIALQETSSFFKDKPANGIERSTVSRWEVVKEIELIALPFLADYNMPNSDIQTIKDEWNNAIGDSVVNQEGRELVEYMAKEIGKDVSNNVGYFKIANFVNYLLNVNEKTKNADGVIYPSVPAGGAGFNVAIKPSVIDEKIKFVGAGLCHLLKRGEHSYLHVMKQSVSVENGIITYEDKDMNNAEKRLYQSYAEGLVFRN